MSMNKRSNLLFVLVAVFTFYCISFVLANGPENPTAQISQRKQQRQQRKSSKTKISGAAPSSSIPALHHTLEQAQWNAQIAVNTLKTNQAVWASPALLQTGHFVPAHDVINNQLQHTHQQKQQEQRPVKPTSPIIARPSQKVENTHGYKPYELFPQDKQHVLLRREI